MGKLLSLKEWVTVSAAARQISIVCGDEVAESDVLQLALDGRLKLSVNFVNFATALIGRIVPENEAPKFKGLISGQELTGGIKLGEGKVLLLDDDIVTLQGVWDLSMLGAERLDVEHEYHNLTGGPSVTLQCLDGAIVERQDGLLCQIQERFENGKEPARLSKNDYYPAGGLPEGSVFVVRTKALVEFESTLKQDFDPVDAPVHPKELDQMLKIIIGMAIDGYGYDPAASRSEVPKEIVAAVKDLQMTTSDDTVRKYLRLAVNTVLPGKR